ncbi:MAG: glycosyltransferase family 2 protein [Lachnospiraceae bacterium]|nr:glycosyltransferase family 2 protein [Lachnospiraceae bacterium]
MKKLIIIPAYNEGESIYNTIKDIEEHAPDFDYIIVNDCSTDNTKEICMEHGFHYIDLPINQGIGGAVQTGYLYAAENGYDIAVQVDGDGQHNPEFLEQMAEVLQRDQADMVIGSRFIERKGFQSSAARRIGIRYFTGLIRLMTGKKITDPTSGLRMAGRDVILIFAKSYPRDYPEPESVVDILCKNKKVEEVPVLMRERQGGISSIRMGKSVYYMIKVSLAIILCRIAQKRGGK